MKKIQKLKEIIAEAEMQAYIFKSKENLRAGIRCRKLLSEVKIIAQEIRMEMLEEKEKLLLNRSKKIKNSG